MRGFRLLVGFEMVCLFTVIIGQTKEVEIALDYCDGIFQLEYFQGQGLQISGEESCN